MTEKKEPTEPIDPVEDVVKHVHVVIPLAGAVLIFLMAFIAMTVA